MVTLQELQSMSEAQIEAENKARVDKQKEEEKKKQEGSGFRTPMDMRFRSKLSQMVYGT